MRHLLWLTLWLFAVAAPGDADEAPSPFAALEWRNIGPSIMGGRVSDVEGVPGDPRIVYVGAASGGVWKTKDGGITWKPIFDGEPVSSIGDIALEPGNPSVVYVGTGEANLRNSVSFGNGVYKSTDGGASWRALGLSDTRHISRIVIDPRNPERVYVGAFGHAFGPNAERGVFRSLDSGETWEKVLYLDDRHGVSDLDIDPENPNVLYAALWHFERKPWTLQSGSEQGGVYKSVDGGTTWKRLEKDLPRLLGRIGVKAAPSQPNVVYVLAESREGTLFRSEDRGESFTKVSTEVSIVSRGFYYADLRVDPANENRVFSLAGSLNLSIDGGKSFERIARSMHSDHHALWIDPEDPERIWQGHDGGVGVSYNGGKSWEFVDVLPIGQFYAIFADSREPFYYVGGGLQDNATWYGPSRNGEPFGILPDDWREISNGDGFQAVFHPDEPEITLTEYQGGRIVRTDNRTREMQFVSPYAPTMGGAPASAFRVRFNWNAPIVASPRDGKTVYFAGNKVFRTRDFGATWETLSPDLTTNDPEKMASAGGPIWQENSTAEYHCTILSFAESPAAEGVLWAGTDDGNLQVSRDDGRSWENVIGKVPGVPKGSPVSHVEASRKGPGIAYVSFDRHMFDDLGPYVFRTENSGRSFVEIGRGLPENAYVWVLREDPRNPDLLYAGTELGLYATRDGGTSWERLHLKNLPTVAVHDLMIHPRENDLIVGTHGRGLFLFDDATPIQRIAETRDKSAHLFPIRRAVRFQVKPTRYGIGDKTYVGPNPPYGALASYFLKEELDEKAALKLELLDEGGSVLRTIEKLPRKAGVQRTSWDLNLEPPAPRKPK
ncbi:MAG: WD40/YVTN/BNR-like repeat-containing protein, partial [Vicinamibacteria bacterium]